MLTFLISSSILVAGFGLGYAACLWRSYRRHAQRLTTPARHAGSHTTTFGHARRAF
jgi:hypothetical protein